MPYPLTYRELLALSEDELITLHDKLVLEKGTIINLDYYLEALRYKAQDRQTERMLSYTRWITVLTVVVTLATIVNVFIAWKLLPK
jgi:hypothetical protein